jgi:RimJ/RimL family protein N-acetyltransferase
MAIRETARLLLRPPTGTDLDAFIQIHSDPEVVQYLTLQGDPGRAGAWRMLALLVGHWQLRGYGQWTVIEKASGHTVGRVGLWNPDGWPGIEVGWVIRRSHWNRGYATEAAREAVAYAFDAVGADHVISLIAPDNHRSIRIAEKIGERFERAMAQDGREVHVYGVAREAWKMDARSI